MEPGMRTRTLPPLDAGVIEQVRASWRLTDRQTAVTARVARGLSNKEVAAELQCEESTVEKHLRDVFRKTGFQGRVALAVSVWIASRG